MQPKVSSPHHPKQMPKDTKTTKGGDERFNPLAAKPAREPMLVTMVVGRRGTDEEPSSDEEYHPVILGPYNPKDPAIKVEMTKLRVEWLRRTWNAEDYPEVAEELKEALSLGRKKHFAVKALFCARNTELEFAKYYVYTITQPLLDMSVAAATAEEEEVKVSVAAGGGVRHALL